MSQNSLPRAKYSEEVGIPSRAICEFLADCENNKIELHSFMILRHGIVAAEGWYKPFNSETAHTMFSVSKSVVGTAIGFAVHEGKLTLETPVYSLFPEYISKRIVGKNAKALKIKHLLTMTSGKSSGIILKMQKPEWVKNYLSSAFLHTPGKKFNYDSENSYMLSAIIKKVTGHKVVDYLEPRLFEPLGIDKPKWETDPNGTEVGGWGLQLKTEDLAKIMQCYLNNGKWDGKQVIPEEWAQQAGQCHVSKTPGVAPDHGSGYGYQFWRNSVKNSYRADGVFSQLGIVLPDYDMVVVTTGGEPQERRVIEAVWRHLLEVSDTALPQNEAADKKLKDKIRSLSMPELPDTMRREWMEKKISGKLVKFPEFKTTSMLTVVSNFMTSKHSGYLNNILFDFNDDYLDFSWTEECYKCKVKVGYGKNMVCHVKLGGMTYTTASSCAWLDDGSLEIWIRPLEQAQIKKFNFKFLENGKVRMKNWSEKGLYELALFGMDFKGFDADKFMKTMAKGASDVVKPIVEPDVIGEFFDPDSLFS